MSEPTLREFLQELNGLCDARNTYETRTHCTCQLLEAADQLFDASIVIRERINNATLLENICGNTWVEEVINKEVIKRPVIDLVQQGGTMLGIGLLGYTYIMEKAGVRFRNMAGTSAGAINTLLLAALPEKIYLEKSPFNHERLAVKSELLAFLVANKDFSTFLDRPGTIGRAQLWLVKRINAIKSIMPALIVFALLFMVGISYCIYHFLDKHLFNSGNHLTEHEINNYNFIIATLGIFAVILFAVLFIFFLFKNSMGVNPGNAPYEWMKSILKTKYVNIRTTKDLMDKRAKETKAKSVINGKEEVMSKDPRVVFISANLTHNRIVKFPENSIDYWNKNYAGMVSPAAFVRASMSLPFIFYAFIPSDDYVQLPNESRANNTVRMLARFVDGGMLSNFPIREFHVPVTETPSHPTFGVLLGSPKPEPGSDTATIKQKFESLSVFKYILSFISTFRNFYDSDFLRTHPEFSMLVKAVNTDQFNALDFGMDFDTKKRIFTEGANTAIEQLEQFKWQDYLAVRMGTTPKTTNTAK